MNSPKNDHEDPAESISAFIVWALAVSALVLTFQNI